MSARITDEDRIIRIDNPWLRYDTVKFWNGWKKAIEGIRNNTLEEFCVTCAVELTDEHAVTLAEALAHGPNTSLVDLRLQETNISDQGALAVADVLEKNTTLVEVVFHGKFDPDVRLKFYDAIIKSGSKNFSYTTFPPTPIQEMCESNIEAARYWIDKIFPNCTQLTAEDIHQIELRKQLIKYLMRYRLDEIKVDDVLSLLVETVPKLETVETPKVEEAILKPKISPEQIREGLKRRSGVRLGLFGDFGGTER